MEKLQHRTGQREHWVDIVKIFACVLVVLGHFFQSMVKSHILPDTQVYGWFNQTIYYFHVPLFFICSGYLFQKYSCVRSFGQWKVNALKKLISLAIPYLVFSLATYLMKVLFSDSVNQEAGGLAETLLFNPTSPYWYLYALIFIFLLTVTVNSSREALLLLGVALVMKGLSVLPGIHVQGLQYVLGYEIWFVFGMLICFWDIPSRVQRMKHSWGLLSSLMFIAVSILVYRFTSWNDAMAFGLGLFGCASVLLIALKTQKVGFLSKVTPVLAKYTFPVFLMHTIFAAGFRSVLFKIGISNSLIHIVCGMVISFLGPVLAAVIMSKIKWLEFLLYPNKFIRIGVRKK